MADGILLASDVAREFHRLNFTGNWDSASDLVNAVDKLMSDRGLERSTIDRLSVADEVRRLRRHALADERQRADERYEQLASPEQVAWQQNQVNGWGDRRDAELAASVNAMSHQDFARFRQRAGIQKDVLSFLGGI